MNIFYNDKMLPCIDRFICETKDKIYPRAAELQLTMYKTKEPTAFKERTSGERSQVKVGDKWGELWDCAWFFVEGEVPANLRGGKVALKIDLSGEGLVYDENGVEIRGITSVVDTFDTKLGSPAKTVVPLLENAKGGEKVNLWIDAGCNDLFGKFQTGTLREASICSVRDDIRNLWYDMRLLRVLLDQLDTKSARYICILHALFTASLIPDYSQAAVKEASEALKGELDKKGGDSSLKITALGHSHLDLAWLWPIRETRRKALRTFTTALRNLEQYPDYVFCASQPQQFEFVRAQSPALFEQIKTKIAEGRIEPVGAMWVEPDLNVSSGEALIRQVLYGKKYFKDEFGVVTDTVWLPDVFGFNAALVQILAKSQVKNLLTIKLSWNKYTQFPHHSFVWEGMDGASEVLVHMPPEGEYNSAATPESIKIAERKYIEKGVSKNAMMLFGIGDGGGGPCRSHLENLKRMKNIDGLCPVKQRTSVEFFKDLEKERKNLPHYKGEMYLEKHQGTYTSAAKNKLGNRTMERLLTLLEQLAVIGGTAYPTEQLDRLWKETLLYQFHDILPGSSIKRVYDESEVRYSEMAAEVSSLVAIAAMGADCYYNPTSFDRTDIVGGIAIQSKPFQKGEATTLPPANVKADKNLMENGQVKFTFGENGEIISGVLKASGKEILSLGNQMNVYYDDGDCWDISDNYTLKPRKTFKLISSSVKCDGIVASREQIFEFGNSTLKQIITLTSGEDFIKVKNFVNWQESGMMLRADFDTNIVSDTVACDIQFGRVNRTTLSNNVSQYAISEICAQKWIDYAAEDRGVALINDCKYGYSAKDGKLSIDLLRSASYPCENQDKGEQEFAYLIYLHGNESQVEQRAYTFIQPLVKVSKEFVPKIDFAGKNVVVESVKKCEYDDSIIVRLYENRGTTAVADLRINGYSLYETDMTEQLAGKQLKSLQFTPFEIKTVKAVKI